MFSIRYLGIDTFLTLSMNFGEARKPRLEHKYSLSSSIYRIFYNNLIKQTPSIEFIPYKASLHPKIFYYHNHSNHSNHSLRIRNINNRSLSCHHLSNMQFPVITSILGLLSLPLGISALAIRDLEDRGLGINCRGSGNCLGIGGSIDDLLGVISNIDPNRWYNDLENIACIETELRNGLCVFMQGTSGAPGSSIGPLVQALKDHGCKKCGSVPLFFPQGDNNPDDHGILTINAVGVGSACDGLC